MKFFVDFDLICFVVVRRNENKYTTYVLLRVTSQLYRG